jgi:exonuclease III
MLKKLVIGKKHFPITRITSLLGFLSLLVAVSGILPYTNQPIRYDMAADSNNGLAGLNMSCINVNSLNMSSTNKPAQLRKIFGILKLKSDVICLSDVRLSNRNMVSSRNDVISTMRNNIYGSYTAHFNSSSNKRGVGILYNNNITFSVEESRADPDENYLLHRCLVRGKRYIIGAVYGPNNHNHEFFLNLERDLISLGNHPRVLGGDWNLTVSDFPADINPDCFNMVNIPNSRHTNYFRELCNRLNLTDPFRYLHPTTRNYTFCPRHVAAENRSRIDFFVISEEILSIVKDCVISDNLQSSMFDHKSVLLCFKGKSVYKSNKSISCKIINDPVVNLLIENCCFETYITYQDILLQEKRRLLRLTGEVYRDFRSLTPCSKFYRLGDDEEPDELRLRAIDRINTRLQELRTHVLIQNQKNIENDLFFEVLLNNIKNELISYQSYVFRFIGSKKKHLSDELRRNLADPDPVRNYAIIFDIEKKLQVISEREIESALEFHPTFEHLNGEKMSPNFLRLAKTVTDPADISLIKDDFNHDFISDRSREDYIVNYYSNIYSLPENAPVNFDGLIENFLGNEICNNPIVLGSKLSHDESAALDAELTVAELDKAASECKTRSAPGIDGFSNGFIKKYWQFFRFPLLDCAKTCFRKKALTDNFRTGTIRLIPKKGDCSKLKNWRPITLLNCFYKIISRALNYRLQSVSDRLLSRAQKGFTSSRYLQEVILNIAGNIDYCSRNNISGAIVSIDQAKAFDTIYHGYVRAAFKFFGLGDTFLDMLDTLGTNRRAQILLPDNKVSKPFPLGTGRPQGGNLSPLEFNAGEQILLFKIELDFNICSIYRDAAVPRNLFPVPVNLIDRKFALESNAETDKADGFADDTSATTIMEIESLSELKTVLNEFAGISGLKCNFDKTNVLPIGTPVHDLNFVIELGFSVVPELTLLGFRLNSTGLMIDEMFDTVYRKIAGIITSWERYRLSLPGRIGIAKTLCISQLSFIGSVVTPTAEILGRIQNLINNYIVSNLKVAKDRLYRPANEGGLNLINLTNFLTGIQAVWVKRARISSRDNWRVDIRSLTYGNCYLLNPRLALNACIPIKNIASSFARFVEAFYRADNNYREAFILANPLFRQSVDVNVPLNENFFSGNVPRLDMARVADLKFKDFFTGDQFKSLDALCDSTGINFSLMTYMRLGTALLLAKRNLGGGDANRINKAQDLDSFFRIKGGEAKKIRLTLDRTAQANKSLSDLKPVKSFFRITELQADTHADGKFFGFWNEPFLSNRAREFVFKYVYNQLPINTRLSHFVPNRSRNCTFCERGQVNPIPEETFIHLFVDCPTTSAIHNWYCSKYFPVQLWNRSEKIQLFMLGKLSDGSVLNKFILTMAFVVQLLIWEAKLQKRVLQPLTLEQDFIFLVQSCLKASKKLCVEKDRLRDENIHRDVWNV